MPAYLSRLSRLLDHECRESDLVVTSGEVADLRAKLSRIPIGRYLEITSRDLAAESLDLYLARVSKSAGPLVVISNDSASCGSLMIPSLTDIHLNQLFAASDEGIIAVAAKSGDNAVTIEAKEESAQRVLIFEIRGSDWSRVGIPRA